MNAPAAIAGAIIVLALARRARTSDESTKAPTASIADLQAGIRIDPRSPPDKRQIYRGNVIPAGQHVEGQTIELEQAVPHALFYPRSGLARWYPMASGRYAPEWSAAGMPIRAANNVPPGRSPVPVDLGKRIENGAISNYQTGRTRNRLQDPRWGAVVTLGDEPGWMPGDSDLHDQKRADPSSMPDAAPSNGQTGSGIRRRVRGIRTVDGVPLVHAADSVNWSAITAATPAGEQSKYDLYIGAQSWTVVQTDERGSRSVPRTKAEQVLAWVVPGKLDAVNARRFNDSTVRRLIYGEDNRPGGKAWEMPFYRGVHSVSTGRGAPADKKPVPTLLRDYDSRGAVAYLSGWKEFPPTAQNVIRSGAVALRNRVSIPGLWSMDDVFTPTVGENAHDTLLRNQRAGYPFNSREIGEIVYGPIAWARGTASQYQSNNPMIPFALEAGPMLRGLINKTYTRPIKDEQ